MLREARVPSIPGPLLEMRAIVGRAYVRVVGVNRDPVALAIEVTLPLFTVSSLALLYRSLAAPPSYLGYVILGGAMTAYWLNVLWGMASTFYFEKQSGNLPLYLMAPMSRLSILAGMALGGMFTTTLRAVVSATIGCFLFGVTIDLRSAGAATCVFALTLAALYGLGMMTASLFLLWGREAYHLSNLLQEPIYLLAGFYFPVRSLGAVASTFAGFLPITLGLDAMRQLLFSRPGDGLLPVDASIALLAIQSVVYIYLACRMLDYMEWVSRHRGTLTTRYQ